MTDRHVFPSAMEFASQAQRTCHLVVACGNHQDLRRRIDELPCYHQGAGNFMKATGSFVGTAVDKSAVV